MKDSIPLDYIGDASLPRLIRLWIEIGYPSWVIYRIDRAGRFHDYLTDTYPNTVEHNRRSFIKLLERFEIPGEIVTTLHVGLWIYDHLPTYIQARLKRTTV